MLRHVTSCCVALVKKPDGAGEFLWIPEDPVSRIHSPHPHVGVPGIFSDLIRSVHFLKKERRARSNENLPHLFIPGKTEVLVPEFAV